MHVQRLLLFLNFVYWAELAPRFWTNRYQDCSLKYSVLMGAFNMVSNCDTCLKSQETDSLNGKTSINRGETPLKTSNISTAKICEPLR